MVTIPQHQTQCKHVCGPCARVEANVDNTRTAAPLCRLATLAHVIAEGAKTVRLFPTVATEEGQQRQHCGRQV